MERQAGTHLDLAVVTTSRLASQRTQECPPPTPTRVTSRPRQPPKASSRGSLSGHSRILVPWSASTLVLADRLADRTRNIAVEAVAAHPFHAILLEIDVLGVESRDGIGTTATGTGLDL